MAPEAAPEPEPEAEVEPEPEPEPELEPEGMCYAVGGFVVGASQQANEKAVSA